MSDPTEADGEPVVALERLRLLDGEPLSLDASYLPADIGTPLLDLDLTRNDVFVLIERELGLPLGSAAVSIEAVTADVAVAGLLRVRQGSPLLFLEPNMMGGVLIYAFAAATLGGFDSPVGAVVGGLVVGVAETLAGAYVGFIGSDLKVGVPLVIILGVLLLRPQGLFGRAAVERA